MPLSLNSGLWGATFDARPSANHHPGLFGREHQGGLAAQPLFDLHCHNLFAEQTPRHRPNQVGWSIA